MNNYQTLDYKTRANWAHVTDGKNIIYIQYQKYDNNFSVWGVHKPNLKTGTGFWLIKNLRPAELLQSLPLMFASHEPKWASREV